MISPVAVPNIEKGRTGKSNAGFDSELRIIILFKIPNGLIKFKISLCMLQLPESEHSGYHFILRPTTLRVWIDDKSPCFCCSYGYTRYCGSLSLAKPALTPTNCSFLNPKKCCDITKKI